MNDSVEFHDVESICSGKLSHVPSQPAIVASLGGLLSRDPSLRPDTWNLLRYIPKTFLTAHVRETFDVIDTLSRYASLFESKSDRRKPVRERTGKPVARSERKKSRDGFQSPRFARETINHEFMSFQQKECIHRITWLIDLNYRSRNFYLTNSPHLQRFHVGR